MLDLLDDTPTAEAMDVTPGGDADLEEGEQSRHRRRLLDMARQAEALKGDKDTKIQKAKTLVAALLKDGYRPIVFCRFIATAEYVAAALRDALPRDVAVEAVTSELAPAEREARVNQLSETAKHVLVATDCLSEGINLQRAFDAVVHYDLVLEPHPPRAARGPRRPLRPARPQVRVVTYYGRDNPIDGIVLGCPDSQTQEDPPFR